MIQQVRIENYKCLADVTLNLQPFNVLIGPNDTGKTSVLEALSVLGRLTLSSVKDAFARTAGPRDCLRQGGGETIAFCVSMDVEDRECEFAIGVSPEGHVCCELLRGCQAETDYETVQNDKGGVVVQTGGSQTGHPGGQAYFLSFAKPGRSAHDSVSRQIVRQLSSVQYALDARAIAQPSEPARDRDAPPLDPTGKGLATILDYMVLESRELFDELEARLREMVSYVQRLRIGPVDGKREVGFSVGAHEDKIPAPLASDGLLLFLGYLVLLYMPGDRPGLILIDEPENGIHPRRLQEAVHLLRELCQKESVQIVMTTHSPYLLDWVEPQEVHILTRGDDLATQATCMADVPDIELLRKGYQLGELWFNYGEEELIKGVS